MRSGLLAIASAAAMVSVSVLSGCAAEVTGSDGAVVSGELETTVMKPPPGKCAPGDIGCDGIPDGPVAACGAGNNQCFGAVGMNCSGDGLGIVPSESISQVGCQGSSCWVNAGSWLHDQCCTALPNGRWCDGIGSSLNAGCVTQWDTATHRYSHNLGWKRTVDKCAVNNTGTVVFADYCAPTGTIVAAPDAIRCCGRASRGFNASTDAARAIAQGVVLDGSFLPVVCTGVAAPPPPPPPPPAPVWSPETARRCTSQTQCSAGEACVTYPNIPGKICVPM